MRTNYKKQKFLFSLFFLVSNQLFAQTMETNLTGLVIKDYKCNQLSSLWYVNGNLINRNSEPFNGALRVKIIDKENDIIWQSAAKISTGAQNGTKFDVYIGVGNCLAPNKVQITLER
jgi:hypothetical protein